MRILRPGLAAALCTLIAACGTKQSEPPPPALEAIANTRQIMLGITIPSSDVVFQAAAETPKDDAAWEKVQANALALAESGNLLTVGSRVRDQGDWIKQCKALIAAAKEAAQAAQDKNIDKVMETGDKIYEVCDSCHKQYMPARQGETAPE